LTEEEDSLHDESVTITKSTPQFGDVRVAQEDAVRKTINDNVKFSENALRFYPKAEDITLDGDIPSMNVRFQFRYADPSSDGIYIWAEAMQLTDANTRLVGKIRDAYMNWKNSITQEADLIEKLSKACKRD
jgi:hypothetical protein